MKHILLIFVFCLTINERAFPLAYNHNVHSRDIISIPKMSTTTHHARHHHQINKNHKTDSNYNTKNHFTSNLQKSKQLLQPATSSPASIQEGNHLQHEQQHQHQRHQHHSHSHNHHPLTHEDIFVGNTQHVNTKNVRVSPMDTNDEDYDYNNAKDNDEESHIYVSKHAVNQYQEYTRVIRDQSHSIVDGQNHNNDYNVGSDIDNAQKPGALTQQKFGELGTPERVKKAHELYQREREQEKEKQNLAVENLRRMRIATRCKKPLPRVVRVSDDTSKTYTPEAVLLHRCGEDTGCCPAGKVCTVKSTQDVELYFYVVDLANQRTITELILSNHTECDCVDSTILMQQRAKRSGQHNNVTLDSNDIDYESFGIEELSNASCRCPNHFDIIPKDKYSTTLNSSNTNCRCDCLEPNTSCQRLKKGQEGFSIFDRKCIYEAKCAVPLCSFGEYNKYHGRCPQQTRRRLDLNVN